MSSSSKIVLTLISVMILSTACKEMEFQSELDGLAQKGGNHTLPGGGYVPQLPESPPPATIPDSNLPDDPSEPQPSVPEPTLPTPTPKPAPVPPAPTLPPPSTSIPPVVAPKVVGLGVVQMFGKHEDCDKCNRYGERSDDDSSKFMASVNDHLDDDGMDDSHHSDNGNHYGEYKFVVSSFDLDITSRKAIVKLSLVKEIGKFDKVDSMTMELSRSKLEELLKRYNQIKVCSGTYISPLHDMGDKLLKNDKIVVRMSDKSAKDIYRFNPGSPDKKFACLKGEEFFKFIGEIIKDNLK